MPYRASPSRSIAFRDFFPAAAARSTFYGVVAIQEPDFGPLDAATRAANAWIASSGADVLNVETVLWAVRRDGQVDASPMLRLSQGQQGSSEVVGAVQAVRVWYVDEADR